MLIPSAKNYSVILGLRTIFEYDFVRLYLFEARPAIHLFGPNIFNRDSMITYSYVTRAVFVTLTCYILS